jgi:hypothetical protein
MDSKNNYFLLPHQKNKMSLRAIHDAVVFEAYIYECCMPLRWIHDEKKNRGVCFKFWACRRKVLRQAQ